MLPCLLLPTEAAGRVEELRMLAVGPVFHEQRACTKKGMPGNTVLYVRYVAKAAAPQS